MNGKVPAVILNNGVSMPMLGLGVLRIDDGASVEKVVHWALEAGYRSIDTARIYNNEAGVGKAIRESDIPREKIFLTTKVWNEDQGYQKTLDAFDASLERLGLSYVDLYLIHWPGGDISLNQQTWRAMELLYEKKKVRAIGVSNFHVAHLEGLMESAKIVPMVNQIELHPCFQQRDLRKHCLANGIQVEAWRPLMKGKVLDIPLLKKLGEELGKSAAQITLRWMIQHGVVTIPKSQNHGRIHENFNVFDFVLSDLQMAAIDDLDCAERLGPDPDTFSMDF